MIEKITEAIVDRLSSERAALTVAAYPNDPASYRLRGASALLVSWRGQEWSAHDEAAPRRIEAVDYDIVILARNKERQGRSGEEGAQELIEYAAQRLDGFRAEGYVFACVRAEMGGFDEDSRVWEATLTITGYSTRTLRRRA